ncbi:TonB family protein [Parasphingorhabdus sp.]|uniref:energy transducer TonB family protein n=1 Tax=Parasphingorhabdus sp. TaxID=2709688 RepID=UPI002F9201B5
MRSGRIYLTEGRGTGYGQSPAWPQRWGAGLAAASCCLLMLAAIDANLSGLVQSVPHREVNSIKLFTPPPVVPPEPLSQRIEVERPPASQAGKSASEAKKTRIQEQVAGKAISRPTTLSRSAPAAPTILQPSILPSQTKPSPPKPEVNPVQVADDKKASALASYQRLIWARIAARKPKGLHLSGLAMVRFAVSRDGNLTSVELASSSGNSALDKLALRTVRNASPFPAPPVNLETDQLIFTIPFSFH